MYNSRGESDKAVYAIEYKVK